MEVVDNFPFILYTKILYFEFFSWFTNLHGPTSKYVLDNAFLSAIFGFQRKGYPHCWEKLKMWNFMKSFLWRLVHNYVTSCLLPSSDFWILNSCNFFIPCPIWLKLSLIKFNITSIWIRITSHEGFGSL